MLPAIALAGVLVVAIAPDLSLELEAGSEVDTNVYRTGSSPVAAAGARGAARLSLFARPRGNLLLRLSALAAGRVYPDAPDANVGLVSADARADIAVDRLAPGLRLTYTEAGERGTDLSGQDFRSVSAAATLTLRTEDDHRLEASAGGRLFIYKPDEDFDFRGAQLGLTLSRRVRLGDGSDELGYAAGYTLSQRAYHGHALASVCPAGSDVSPSCLYVTPATRSDLFHDVAAEVTFTRAYILGLRYNLQVNDSSSFGQSLVRHRVELSATAGLPLDLYLNARVILIVNQFLDALLLGGDVGTFTTIEDEARNAVILHLSRELGDALTVEARYAYYANAFSSANLDYRRQTVYLGLVYSFGGLRK